MGGNRVKKPGLKLQTSWEWFLQPQGGDMGTLGPPPPFAGTRVGKAFVRLRVWCLSDPGGCQEENSRSWSERRWERVIGWEGPWAELGDTACPPHASQRVGLASSQCPHARLNLAGYTGTDGACAVCRYHPDQRVALAPLSVPYLTPGGLGFAGSASFGLWSGSHSPVRLYQ